MDLGIKNKTVLITGADSGIGKETAKLLLNDGVNVILTDKNIEDVERVQEELKKEYPKSSIFAFGCDLTNNDDVVGMADVIAMEIGGIDILVNSAGARGAAGDFLELTDEDWMETIQIDLMGAVRVARAFIPQMQKKKWGRVINISSENALQPYEEESPYNACKAAIVNFTKCLSRIYGKEKILCNVVSPAYIETPMTNAMMEELAKEKDISEEEAVDWFLKNKRPHIELQRRGQPEEVAAVIAFLCSEKASFVNGSNYRVDAGSVESAFG